MFKKTGWMHKQIANAKCAFCVHNVQCIRCFKLGAQIWKWISSRIPRVQKTQTTPHHPPYLRCAKEHKFPLCPCVHWVWFWTIKTFHEIKTKGAKNSPWKIPCHTCLRLDEKPSRSNARKKEVSTFKQKLTFLILFPPTNFCPRASERRVLPIVGVCKTFFHLHIFSSSHFLILTFSHLYIFSSSSLLIFTSAHLHIFLSLLIFTFSYPHIFSSLHFLIFTFSHLYICSSSHFLILRLLLFTSSHLHILSSSRPHIFTSSHLLFTSSHLLFTSSHFHSCSSLHPHIFTFYQ